MTVKELKEKLQSYKDDAEVVYIKDIGKFSQIDGICYNWPTFVVKGKENAVMLYTAVEN